MLAANDQDYFESQWLESDFRSLEFVIEAMAGFANWLRSTARKWIKRKDELGEDYHRNLLFMKSRCPEKHKTEYISSPDGDVEPFDVLNEWIEEIAEKHYEFGNVFKNLWYIIEIDAVRKGLLDSVPPATIETPLNSKLLELDDRLRSVNDTRTDLLNGLPDTVPQKQHHVQDGECSRRLRAQFDPWSAEHGETWPGSPIGWRHLADRAGVPESTVDACIGSPGHRNPDDPWDPVELFECIKQRWPSELPEAKAGATRKGKEGGKGKRAGRQGGTAGGGAKLLIQSGLVSHHKWNGKRCRCYTPIVVNQFAKQIGVSAGSVSAFLKSKFGSAREYKYDCEDEKRLDVQIKLLNGDISLPELKTAVLEQLNM